MLRSANWGLSKARSCQMTLVRLDAHSGYTMKVSTGLKNLPPYSYVPYLTSVFCLVEGIVPAMITYYYFDVRTLAAQGVMQIKLYPHYYDQQAE